MRKNCPECSAEIEYDSKFCTECGKKILIKDELKKKEEENVEEFKILSKKIKKRTSIIIILVLLGFISATLISANLLGFDFANIELFENKPPAVAIFSDSNFSYTSSGVSFEIDAKDPDGSIKSCKIDFGDGTISQGYNFTHKYENPGTYVVIVTVKDDKGKESKCNITITIEESFIVSANANVTRGDFPLSVSFTGLGKDVFGNITDYHWDFDDGNTSNNQNTTHVFEKPGYYSVILTVTSDRGVNISDKIIIVVKHRYSFKLSGKIINNYHEDVDLDWAVFWNFGDWDYWAPTIALSPYEETDFKYDVKIYDKEYVLIAQWFYPGTYDYGCEITRLLFSNPEEENKVYYIEIKSNGEIDISNIYQPPSPPPPKNESFNIYNVFENLSDNDVLFVPSGTYDIHRTLYIRSSCRVYSNGNVVLNGMGLPSTEPIICIASGYCVFDNFIFSGVYKEGIRCNFECVRISNNTFIGDSSMLSVYLEWLSNDCLVENNVWNPLQYSDSGLNNIWINNL